MAPSKFSVSCRVQLAQPASPYSWHCPHILALHRLHHLCETMGSCFSSNKFQGEGHTLGSSSAAPAAAQPAQSTGGQRLGGAAPASASQPGTNSASAGGASSTDREARARAAERRMSQQATKGTPSQGKLSKQLEEQKTTNALASGKDTEPERVVVSTPST